MELRGPDLATGCPWKELVAYGQTAPTLEPSVEEQVARDPVERVGIERTRLVGPETF